MESRKIIGHDKYIIDDNYDIFNFRTKHKISRRYNSTGSIVTKLSNGKPVILARIIYENFIGELKSDECVIHKDNNFDNISPNNLEKVDRCDIFKNKAENLDKNKEWKIIKNYSDYKISNFGDIYSIKLKKLLNPNKNLCGTL